MCTIIHTRIRSSILLFFPKKVNLVFVCSMSSFVVVYFHVHSSFCLSQIGIHCNYTFMDVNERVMCDVLLV